MHATDETVARKRDSYKATPLATVENSDLLEQYKSVIQSVRNEWLRVPTKSGRPKKGPRWYAITRCTNEDELGLTSSSYPKTKRWVCKTCLSLCVPVWSDGPLPDLEDIEQEWADVMADKEIRSFR